MIGKGIEKLLKAVGLGICDHKRPAPPCDVSFIKKFWCVMPLREWNESRWAQGSVKLVSLNE